MKMNLSRITCCSLLALIGTLAAHAQVGMTIKQFAGEQYYTYEIKNKETLYGIAHKVELPEELLLTYNPWASGKLEKKQLLLVPVAAVGQSYQPEVPDVFDVSATQPAVSHTLQAGENVCTVAKTYNASVEGILASNPALAPSAYQPGEVLRVVPGSAMPFSYDKTTTVFQAYKVEKGDTYASLAHRCNVSMADLLTINPNTKKPKKGKMMVLPEARVERRTGTMATVSQADLEAYYLPRLDALYEKMLAERMNKDINIGIILPFQLHKSAPPKQAYLYTDFYKGFLIALDSLKHDTNRKVNVKVYDTQHSLNVTDSLLLRPEMRTLDVIIAPSEPKQLERINNFGKQNGIDVLNCFTTKNDDHAHNPYVYQVNTPTKNFTENVLRWFDKAFDGHEVIFLDDPDAEDKDIFADIKAHIQAKGQPSTTLTVTGDLSYDRVSRVMNPGTSYVFIPSSSSKNVLKKVMRALKQAKSERFDCDMALVGYPEYVLYLKDYQDDLQTVDTYMFSRFFNAKGYRTRDFDALYKRWFGGETLVSYPNMGLLGYDTAMFIVKTLNSTGMLASPDTHKGIQTPFRFERESSEGGYVNQAIDIVHFTPSHTIITEVK